MAYRTITKTMVKTVRYSRAVTVQVEETPERVKDEKLYPGSFSDDAEQAAICLAKKNTLTGWEPCGKVEYSAWGPDALTTGKNVDVII